ncbi:MAG: hypothetical protein V1647_01175, partial [Pseudomonadota bacterium]
KNWYGGTKSVNTVTVYYDITDGHKLREETTAGNKKAGTKVTIYYKDGLIEKIEKSSSKNGERVTFEETLYENGKIKAELSIFRREVKTRTSTTTIEVLRSFKLLDPTGAIIFEVKREPITKPGYNGAALAIYVKGELTAGTYTSEVPDDNNVSSYINSYKKYIKQVDPEFTINFDKQQTAVNINTKEIKKDSPENPNIRSITKDGKTVATVVMMEDGSVGTVWIYGNNGSSDVPVFQAVKKPGGLNGTYVLISNNDPESVQDVIVSDIKRGASIQDVLKGFFPGIVAVSPTFFTDNNIDVADLETEIGKNQITAQQFQSDFKNYMNYNSMDSDYLQPRTDIIAKYMEDNAYGNISQQDVEFVDANSKSKFNARIYEISSFGILLIAIPEASPGASIRISEVINNDKTYVRGYELLSVEKISNTSTVCMPQDQISPLYKGPLVIMAWPNHLGSGWNEALTAKLDVIFHRSRVDDGSLKSIMKMGGDSWYKYEWARNNLIALAMEYGGTIDNGVLFKQSVMAAFMQFMEKIRNEVHNKSSISEKIIKFLDEPVNRALILGLPEYYSQHLYYGVDLTEQMKASLPVVQELTSGDPRLNVLKERTTAWSNASKDFYYLYGIVTPPEKDATRSGKTVAITYDNITPKELITKAPALMSGDLSAMLEDPDTRQLGVRIANDLYTALNDPHLVLRTDIENNSVDIFGKLKDIIDEKSVTVIREDIKRQEGTARTLLEALLLYNKLNIDLFLGEEGQMYLKAIEQIGNASDLFMVSSAIASHTPDTDVDPKTMANLRLSALSMSLEAERRIVTETTLRKEIGTEYSAEKARAKAIELGKSVEVIRIKGKL